MWYCLPARADRNTETGLDTRARDGPWASAAGHRRVRGQQHLLEAGGDVIDVADVERVGELERESS